MEIVSLYENIEYGEHKPAVKVLIDNTNLKEIRIAFRKGQDMKEHKTGFPIVVQIVEGTIDFGVKNMKHVLTKGMLIALEADVPHDLFAVEDSIIRLSLNKADKLSRLHAVIND